MEPCWACHWGHCSTVTVKEGKAKGYVGEEPEFEIVAMWTMNIGSDDIGEAVRLNDIGNKMGFDAKELGYLVSMLMECFSEGILTLEDTGGLDLSWGNTESVAKLIPEIAFKRGFGAKLVGGVKKTAELIGGEALNKAVYMGRGLAPHGVNGRPFWSLWYNLNLSDTGSFYGGAAMDPDIGNTEPIGLYDADKIGKYMPNNANKTILYDTLGVCYFMVLGATQPTIDALNAATGGDMTKDEYFEVGKRIRAISRAYNILNGLTPEIEMSVSPRYARDPSEGAAAGKAIGVNRENIYRDYYEVSGWDKETSKPLPETLRNLGLGYMIKDLWPDYAGETK